MKIAVLSDIHANSLALQAVLEDSVELAIDRYWFLGDAVGYGPDPIESLLWVKYYLDPEDWVLGNHDAMLANLLSPTDLEGVNETPKQAIALNRLTLEMHSEANNFWQKEFRVERTHPRWHSIDGLDYVLIHGAQAPNSRRHWPSDPEDGLDYVLIHGAQANHLLRYVYPWQKDLFLPAEFEHLQTRHSLKSYPVVQCFGHTHVPTLVFGKLIEDRKFCIESTYVIPNYPYKLSKNLTLLNPGSVGQPRDLDRRAAYAILDTELQTVTFRRVRYDWQAGIQKLIQADYPESLRKRLRDASAIDMTPDDWLRHYRSIEGIDQ